MGAAIHVKGGDGAEEILRIADSDRGRLFAAHERHQKHQGRSGHNTSTNGEASTSKLDATSAEFDVNVVGVRTKMTKKGRLRRPRAHDEFLIRTRQPGGYETYVSRRYGDFARLADTLRIEFPEEEIPRPPAKDRRETDVKSNMHRAESSTESTINERAPQIGNLAIEVEEEAGASKQDLTFSPSSHASATFSPELRPDNATRSARSSTSDTSARPIVPGPLARERNRLTLRAYIRALLSNPHVAESEALTSFLLTEPTILTPAEEDDTQARETLDAVRDDEAQRFSAEATRRVTELRHHLQSFKADLIQRDGLTRVFSTIKSTPNIEELPESYQALIAWGRISLASTLFHLFVGSDTSSDIFGQLKRIHGLMPYFVLRSILRISNPVSMIRGVLDLFLAQPFGQRSLLQRMLTSNIQEEVRELGEMANRISSKVDDDLLAERIRCFVYAPLALQTEMRNEAERDRLDIITVILKSNKLPSYPPEAMSPLPLNRGQVHRVVRSSRAYELYKEYRASLGKNETDEGPDAVDEQAWLYEDLHVLLKCLTRMRDKEQLISLLFEGVTSELLKDIVTIFYSPLAQVYKAANIADSLSDLQAFINDLIRTVEMNEEISLVDPQRTVQVFIDLVARHEGRFYAFVHQVHSKGSGLFDGLMHWIELFINFVRGPDLADNADAPAASADTTAAGSATSNKQRRGVGDVDLEICLPAGGQERKRVLHEIDCVVVHAYRLKLMRELKLKRRLADREVRGAAKRVDAGDVSSWGIGDGDDDTAFVNAMAENLGVGDAFTDEVNEVEDEEEAEAEEDEENDSHGAESKYYYNDEDEEDVSDTSASSAPSSDSDSDAAPALPEKSGTTTATRESSEASRAWRPPIPQRSISTLTARAANKELPTIPLEEACSLAQKRRRRMPKAPTLTAIPELLPLFVEMVRPLLRPARSASGSSVASVPVSPGTTMSYGAQQPFYLSQPPSRTNSPRQPAVSRQQSQPQQQQQQQPPGGWHG